MSQPVTDYRNELKLLRQRVEASEREIAQLRRRAPARAVPPRHVRLAITTTDGEEYYPGWNDNTLPFKYVENAFDMAQGTQTTTTTDRSATKRCFGQAADEKFIPVNTFCLAVEQANGNTILVPVFRDYWYSGFLGSTGLGLMSVIPELYPVTAWAVDATYPVFWGLSGFGWTNQIGPMGWYRFAAKFYVVAPFWVQPDDNVHHFAHIQFGAYLDGTAIPFTSCVASFEWPARRTSTAGAHAHTATIAAGGIPSHSHGITIDSGGDHHHTFSEIDNPTRLVAISNVVEKPSGSGNSQIFIMPETFTASTGGPVLGDFHVSPGWMEITPITGP